MVPPLAGSMPPRTSVLHSRRKYVERILCERAMKYFSLRSYETRHANCALSFRRNGRAPQLVRVHQLQQGAKARVAIRIDDPVHAYGTEMSLKGRDNRGKRYVHVGRNPIPVSREHRCKC